MKRPSIATYRLQLRHRLDFAAAKSVLPYLDELGVTDCYASPLLSASPGSTHGYDVIDHTRMDPSLGGDAEWLAFATELREREMGLLLDIVPNHMSIANALNGWWRDVLENGPSSPFARHFDVDWDPPKRDLKAKVLLPILGDQFGRVLERGEISIRYEGASFIAAYFETTLPIAPRTWSHLLEPMLVELKAHRGDTDLHVLELESILTSLSHLPVRTDTDPDRVRERHREKEIARRRLAALVESSPEAAAALERSIRSINGTPGDPSSVRRLESLLADQGYRPSFWRVAADEINYRRFFDINELAAIRIEEPAVFLAVHDVALQLAKQGLVTGLRIDHVDGLLSPRRYLQDLREALSDATGAAAPYVVVEKILSPGERLPTGWPVHGTTGYEVAALVTGLLLDPEGVDAVSRAYGAFTGLRTPLPDVIYESKKLVLKTAMSAELTVLARKLDAISEQHRASRDFTLNSLQEAVGELVACFPVYRTYIEAEDRDVGEDDRARIEHAIVEAKRRNAATSASIYDFIRSLLLLEHPPGLEREDLAARRDFVLRFQQLTSPVMAKGLEDTTFYRYVPLAALNEVGSGCHHPPVTVESFHEECRQRATEWPLAMSATATHDTKRGEDVRARLCVLSEVPGLWQAALARLSALARPHKPHPAVPDSNEEYLLYQTLLGAWPAERDGANDASFVDRIAQYMNKALKEAKVHTSWISPNDAYDRDVRTFVERLLDPERGAAFLAELASLRKVIEPAGHVNSLSQVVLKVGMPGVPDFYQGTELWDYSLVDPDNRRPVDFELRKEMLSALRREGERDPAALVDRLLEDVTDGRIKMYVTYRALACRRAFREVFAGGTYEGLTASGSHGQRVIGFARSHGGRSVLVLCGRHFTGLTESARRPVGDLWKDTVLDLGSSTATRFRDAFTGRFLEASSQRSLALRDVFSQLPVAMLEAQS